ncbi:MAG: isoaspartyl peptidase/L-asparaginase [Planctomycetota bacterium]
MNERISRRAALAAGVVAAAGAKALGSRRAVAAGDDHRGAASIASGNGVATVERALARVGAGVDPVLAVVEGVGIVEADPDDLTVGLGGLPNEDGVIELDSSVMHGPTHKAGAVAALRNIVHPAQVALRVLQTTDHVMIVGEGALRFAKAHGFDEQDLMTDKTREIWLRWKRNLSPNDDWLDDEQQDWSLDGRERADAGVRLRGRGPQPFTYGTIHCGATNGRTGADGNVSACTTTSGLSYKIPGRVGDSPIIGAGMYVDNEVGSAGATGRGEAVIQSCGSFSAVRHMADGKTPTEACLEVLKEMAHRTKRQRRLIDDRGRPNYNVVVYALRRDGAYGSASMWSGRDFAVATAAGARREACAFLYERARAEPSVDPHDADTD